MTSQWKYGSFLSVHTLDDCPLSDDQISKYAYLSTQVQKLLRDGYLKNFTLKLA